MKTFNFLAPVERYVEKKLEETPPEKLYPRLLAALIVLGYLPLLIPGIPHGHDSFYHLARLMTLREGFRAGEWLPLIHYDAMAGFGYGHGLFYSDLYFFPFGLLAAAGLPIVTVYKLFLFVMGALTAASMYHAARTISGKPFAGFAAALLYTWSSYYATDVIIRAEIIQYPFPVGCPGAFEAVIGLFQTDDVIPKHSLPDLSLLDPSVGLSASQRGIQTDIHLNLHVPLMVNGIKERFNSGNSSSKYPSHVVRS